MTAATKRLRELVQRRGKVLAVLGAPNAYHAKIMDAVGVEAAFIGTSITGGNYTGLPDTGVLSASECVEFGGYIARSASFPVILDGDTRHGGLTAFGAWCRNAFEQVLPEFASMTRRSKRSEVRR
jgi:2-methylisocitrate lyase-like PEP mutase family enzyme